MYNMHIMRDVTQRFAKIEATKQRVPKRNECEEVTGEKSRAGSERLLMDYSG